MEIYRIYPGRQGYKRMLSFVSWKSSRIRARMCGIRRLAGRRDDSSCVLAPANGEITIIRLRLYTGHWPAGRTSDCGTLAPHSSIKAACYTHPTNSRHALQTQSAHAQTQPGRTPHRICCKANDTQRPCGRTTNATEQHQEQQNTKLTRTHQTRQH